MTDSSNQKDITPTKGFSLQKSQEQQQNVPRTPPSLNNSFLGFKKTSLFARTAISSPSPSKEIANDNSNGTEVAKVKPAIFKTKFAGFSIIKKGVKVSPSKVLANKPVEDTGRIGRPLNTTIPKIPLRPIETMPSPQSENIKKEIQPSTFISTPVETKSLFSSSSSSVLSDPIDYTFEEEDLSIKDKEFDKSEKDLFELHIYLFILDMHLLNIGMNILIK